MTPLPGPGGQTESQTAIEPFYRYLTLALEQKELPFGIC
jgi:hypothetical protein